MSNQRGQNHPPELNESYPVPQGTRAGPHPLCGVHREQQVRPGSLRRWEAIAGALFMVHLTVCPLSHLYTQLTVG